MPRINPVVRAQVYRRDKFACRYCGCSVQTGEPWADDAATLDHVTPRSRGGQNAVNNLRTACRACNQAKADASIHEYEMAGRPRNSAGPGAALKRGYR